MFWMIIAALVAGLVKGLCGFANTLVFTSICSFTNNNIDISPVEIIVATPGNYLIAIRERKYLDWKIWLLPSVLVLLGDIPGIFILKNTDASLIKIVFGFVVIALGLEMLVKNLRGSSEKMPFVFMLVIGLVSGLLCGLYGVGALLSAYVGNITDDSHSFKANISMIFCIESTFRIIVYIFTGIFTVRTLSKGLLLMPFMLFACWTGMKLGSRIDEKKVRYLVIICLLISGAALIFNNM